MNIKTLEYIHNLLKAETERARKAHEKARNALNALKDLNPDADLSKEIETRNKSWRDLCDASDALNFFEGHEW